MDAEGSAMVKSLSWYCISRFLSPCFAVCTTFKVLLVVESDIFFLDFTTNPQKSANIEIKSHGEIRLCIYINMNLLLNYKGNHVANKLNLILKDCRLP